MFELNCVSSLGMIQEIYPFMAARKSGLFVNILTSCCLFSNPMTGSYSASKDAMEGISKILTKEAKRDNIGVCNVYPGGVDTNFRATANPDYLKPETIAKLIRNCIETEDGCVHDIVIRPFIEDNMP
jgi:short-subunit dehydrogenase